MQANKLDLTEGSKFSYPGHGVVRLREKVTKYIGGKEVEFLVLETESGCTIFVPAHMVQTKGIRELKSIGLLTLRALVIKSQPIGTLNNTWNRRQREYMELVKSGDFKSILRVYVELYRISANKILSFGERKMKELAEDLLVSEISESNSIDRSEALEILSVSLEDR